jgi:hypothetical protein
LALMNRTSYTLRPRSGAWTGGPDSRFVGFDITVQRDGRNLGGHNVQAAFGAAGRSDPRHDVALTLGSGWCVTLRNQFAQAPEVALEILRSAQAGLELVTADANAVQGVAAHELSGRVLSMTFEAVGPDYWR